ncbi:MAG: inositol monophosphatase family protein [Desulfuromonadales bacterium]
MKNLIIKAAREAGALLMENFERGIRVEFKGKYDLVTEADRQAEALIVRQIREHFPGHDILAEEDDYGELNSDHRWIIDPLDGTTNFAHGFPWFAVSIALEVRGQLTLGAVYNPYVGEFYFAERGVGAFLNERRLKVSETNLLERADFDGNPMTLDSLECLASNVLIHEAMQKILQPGCRPHALPSI